MNTHITLKAALVVAALLALPLAQAATLSKGDYLAGKTRIGADYKTDKAACDAQAGNASIAPPTTRRAGHSISSHISLSGGRR